MSFVQEPLPYDSAALEPHISAHLLSFHFGKHHAGYVTKLNAAVTATPALQGKTLSQIIVETGSGGVFNNAAQHFNHAFFWKSMKPNGGGKPEEKSNIAAKINADFGSYEEFASKFKAAAATQFGSGWAWLVLNADKKLEVVASHDAETPLTAGHTPILTLDVWEHAYYLDYQNRRPDFITAYVDNLINWDFAEANLNAAN